MLWRLFLNNHWMNGSWIILSRLFLRPSIWFWPMKWMNYSKRWRRIKVNLMGRIDLVIAQNIQMRKNWHQRLLIQENLSGIQMSHLYGKINSALRFLREVQFEWWWLRGLLMLLVIRAKPLIESEAIRVSRTWEADLDKIKKARQTRNTPKTERNSWPICSVLILTWN